MAVFTLFSDRGIPGKGQLRMASQPETSGADGAESAEKPTYEDENGNQVEYDETYNINGVDIVIEPMTQEEVEEVLGFMQSVDQLYTNNQALIDIISEEAAPYFAGQKNVKEVVDIIQNRVQIYVSENR